MDGATRERVQAMTEQAREALDRCLGAGADQAEVSLNSDRGLSVGVRNGEVETIEYNRDKG
ncbi:MAG TPA: metalloprotease PmbA, partial [Xanthomonadales bacterium]|nr:metalloprotease PmbA [Xanthomonadales bacterium]